MSIEWFRDLIICIWGLVTMGALIFIAVLSYSLYRRTKPILESMKTTSKTIQGVTSYAADEAAKPLIEVVALIQGVRQGIEVVTRMFKKQKGGNDV